MAMTKKDSARWHKQMKTTTDRENYNETKLALKAPSKSCSTLQSEINLDISCDSSAAEQMIHMKCQDVFSLKNKKKMLKKCHLLLL